MLFFALFGLILTVQVSLWSYQAQKLERAGGGYEPTGEGDSGAMISATARGGVSTRNDDDQEEISF